MQSPTSRGARRFRAPPSGGERGQSACVLRENNTMGSDTMVAGVATAARRRHVRMRKIFAGVGSMVASTVLGLAGSQIGVMTGFMLGMVGTGVGMYAGYKLAEHLGV